MPQQGHFNCWLFFFPLFHAFFPGCLGLRPGALPLDVAGKGGLSCKHLVKKEKNSWSQRVRLCSWWEQEALSGHPGGLSCPITILSAFLKPF